jgi:hypothetical protein
MLLDPYVQFAPSLETADAIVELVRAKFAMLIEGHFGHPHRMGAELHTATTKTRVNNGAQVLIFFIN